MEDKEEQLGEVTCTGIWVAVKGGRVGSRVMMSWEWRSEPRNNYNY